MLLVLHSDPSPQRLDSQDLIIEPSHGGRYQNPSALPVRRRTGGGTHGHHGLPERRDGSAASSDIKSS